MLASNTDYLCFNDRFPDGSRLAGTRTSSFWSLLELRLMGVVLTNGAIRHEKLQTNGHQQQTNTQLFTGPTNAVKALKGKLFTHIK